VKPAAFDYVAPPTVEQAVAALAAGDGDARILAGGQSLVPAMNARLARPALLIDINRIAGLDAITIDAGQLAVGALVRHHKMAMSPAVAAASPLLARAAMAIGHDAIRRRGTVCGSLAHADPAAQWPMMACLFDAELVAQGPGDRRRIAARDFFRGIFETSLASDEMLVEVRFAQPDPDERGALRWTWRRHGDFVTGAVALRLVRDAGGRVAKLRAVAGGFAAAPVDLSAVLAPALGTAPDPARIGALASGAVFEPLSDLRASATYRRDLLPVLVARAVEDAIA
jgi:carbon-monoxide dehydrogenase medium subunit